MVMNNKDLDLEVDIYGKISTFYSDNYEVDLDKLVNYLAAFVRQIEGQQERICVLEAKLSRCEDEISELNRDNYDYQLR